MTQTYRQRMRADYKVVLDACVLAPANICDLFLRLAQSPRLYNPLWTEEILKEVHRTQIDKLGFPQELADSWQSEVRSHFPEAMVEGYEPLIDVCSNHVKDRHVLAAAIHAKAELIITANMKDFPIKSTAPWNIEVKHPADYLLTLYSIEEGVFVSKLHEAAMNRLFSPQEYLAKLGKSLPTFASELARELGWDLC